jgi:glycosyltransferase involved in cell wall biosynthesis
MSELMSVENEPMSAVAICTTNVAADNLAGAPIVMHARVVTGVGGGPDKTILNSPRFLRQADYLSVCLFLRGPNDHGFDAIRQRAATWQVPLVEIDDRGPLDWRVVTRCLAACREHRVSIWHGHDYKSNLLGLLLRRRWPMRLVTTVHGWVKHTQRTPLYYMLDRWSLRRYERVLCVSQDILQQCRDLGVADEKSLLIENAIDTDEFRRRMAVDDAKQRLSWPAGRLLVGAAGRLSEEKGFDILLRSIHNLVNQGLDVGLIIAGDGQERAALGRLAGELRLQDRVRFVGFQNDLRRYYEAMDLYALSSHREGLPNVLLEAMALETPVVATRVAGIPRLIADGESGLLVDAGNEAALTAAISRALLDRNLRDRLAVAGRRTIEERYSFAARMKKVTAVYDSLVPHANGKPGI